MGHSIHDRGQDHRPAWNAGHKLGAKRPLKPKQVWAIRFWLERERRLRDRALFDLAIDSKLRGCDLVKVRIGDLVSGGRVRARAVVIQQKTGRPVRFELLEPARTSILDWLERRGGTLADFAFPSRIDPGQHISTRQYARLVDEWVITVRMDMPRSRFCRDLSAIIHQWFLALVFDVGARQVHSAWAIGPPHLLPPQTCAALRCPSNVPRCATQLSTTWRYRTGKGNGNLPKSFRCISPTRTSQLNGIR